MQLSLEFHLTSWGSNFGSHPLRRQPPKYSFWGLWGWTTACRAAMGRGEMEKSKKRLLLIYVVLHCRGPWIPPSLFIMMLGSCITFRKSPVDYLEQWDYTGSAGISHLGIGWDQPAVVFHLGRNRSGLTIQGIGDRFVLVMMISHWGLIQTRPAELQESRARPAIPNRAPLWRKVTSVFKADWLFLFFKCSWFANSELQQA